MNPRIVFIDDELMLTGHYRRALELDGITVVHYTSIDACKEVFSKKRTLKIAMFVIDIMMPSEPRYTVKETHNGDYTGLFLAFDLRKAYPDVPIILYSGSSVTDIRKSAERTSKNIDCCIFLNKHENTPQDLADIVRRYVSEKKLERNRKSNIFQRLFGSLLLQPNVGGIGVDLKKLGE